MAKITSEMSGSDIERKVKPTAFDWVPPHPWICLRCLLTVWSRAAGPRCPRCFYIEGS